jgi:peptidoglycan/LPS O-acetylase OafA/YrhL
VIFYFAWSLATEEQFYLVWPTIEKAFGGMAIPAIIGIVLLARTIVEKTAPEAGLWATVLLSIHPAILYGVLLAHTLHDPRGFAMVEKSLSRTWFGPAMLVATIVVTGLLGPKWLIWTLMTLLVGAAVIRERNGLPFLRWRPFAYVGTISYGMYLVHLLCHNAVKRALPSHEMLWFPATVAVTIVVAGISPLLRVAVLAPQAAVLRLGAPGAGVVSTTGAGFSLLILTFTKPGGRMESLERFPSSVRSRHHAHPCVPWRHFRVGRDLQMGR